MTRREFWVAVATSLAIALTILLILFAADAAAIEVGVQDDQAVVYNWHDRAAMLSEFKAMGGTHVRINVLHAWGDDLGLSAHAPLYYYDGAVAAILAHGLTPQLTLTWYQQDDPAKIARWMREMAAHFGPRVDRYSVLNEPDGTIPAADDCDPETVTRLVRSGAITSVMRKRVRRVRYRGKVTRRGSKHYGRVRGKRVRIYRTRKGGSRGLASLEPRRASARRLGRWHRRVLRIRPMKIDSRVDQHITGQEVRSGCILYIRGRKYGRIARRAIPAIRAADPGAQVLAGETSPTTGVAEFIAAAGDTGADAWAHHPYDWFGHLTGVEHVREASGLPVYATEFGVKPGDGERLQRSWRKHAAEGARQVLQYQWFRPAGHSWDTSIESVGRSWLTDAIRAVR